MKNVKYQTSERDLNNDPAKTYRACIEAEKSCASPDDPQAKNWEALKKNAEAGIAKKRLFSPGYAPDTIPFLKRTVEDQNHISTLVESAESITYRMDVEKTLASLELYQNSIAERNLTKTFDLCQNEYNELEKETEFNTQYKSLRKFKALRKDLWLVLLEHNYCKKLCFNKKKSNHFTRALKIVIEQQNAAVIDNLIQDNILIIPIDIMFVLCKIRDEENDYLKFMENDLQDDISHDPERILKFLNAASTADINWGRFSKKQSEVTRRLLAIMDPERIPLWLVQFDRFIKSQEEEKLRQLGYFMLSMVIISLATAIELYRQNFQSEIYIVAPIFLFLYSLILSLNYYLISLQLADEAVIANIKEYYNSLVQNK